MTAFVDLQMVTIVKRLAATLERASKLAMRTIVMIDHCLASGGHKVALLHHTPESTFLVQTIVVVEQTFAIFQFNATFGAFPVRRRMVIAKVVGKLLPVAIKHTVIL